MASYVQEIVVFFQSDYGKLLIGFLFLVVSFALLYNNDDWPDGGIG